MENNPVCVQERGSALVAALQLSSCSIDDPALGLQDWPEYFLIR